MPHIKQRTVFVKGMHCPSCDILIQDKFSELDNVCKVKPNHATQKVEVHYTGHLDTHALNRKIIPFGYQISTEKELCHEPLTTRIRDAGAIAAIVFILYFFAQELKILPEFSTSSGLTIVSVFFLGLVASTSTCMATAGALFLATIGKMRSSWIPAIGFNLGRIASYGFFGFLTGLVGKTISNDFQMGSLLTLVVSLMMILIGLDMLKIISLSSILPTGVTKGLFQSLERRLIRSPKKTSFFLGAITFFLPCGFTQTVQVYALGVADPIQSALLMTMFALGTAPALLAIGFASSFAKSSYFGIFSKVVGVIIVMVGVSYFTNFLTLAGIPVFAQSQTGGNPVAVKDGYQMVEMSVDARGYTPNTFVIRQSIPVRWIIKGENVFGCQGLLVAPKIGFQKVLDAGDNIVEFTPNEKGTITFSCAMGMYRGSFTVI